MKIVACKIHLYCRIYLDKSFTSAYRPTAKGTFKTVIIIYVLLYIVTYASYSDLRSQCGNCRTTMSFSGRE